ncbi:hypothetical protein [Variovorax sp. PCZ-1]|uniref:hypothetical protein n=1 Tax=Variovorax sp. PCZ-1 TaxID=2835533 RepID=UPI001BD18932|nr:hypothetical protein [Variovorax sp. PCZ-1]MBS7806372.1 hypothetical protein [Variovorax sp. PCZ-1]
MSNLSAAQELKTLSEQLLQVQADQLRTADLVHTARVSQALLTALPEKYSLVLNDILDRLESGALFTEESCSFSQRDLLDSLAVWVNKAQATLNTSTSQSA